ncbi:hypothetical protein DYB28_003036 [Aphanomyces astaci]|uniref:Uncharacterized protein n=1 Tax=Aphanomyces astaci TaxID=112090 RepID=A0A397BLZ2_APHAT|nr:hypothetical protein DYB36_014040 [Aphanomyces astaci]RLN99148.1 hypothetical protein DYB28_003036 [Aphanomyces astaci]
MFGTDSEEEDTEQVQILQDIVDRRAAMDEVKKTKKGKEQKRRNSLESTGSQLCMEVQKSVRNSKAAQQDTQSLESSAGSSLDGGDAVRDA